jgi:exopolysaccharide production protein ExoQ
MTGAQLVGLLVPSAIFVSVALALALVVLLQYRLTDRTSPEVKVAAALAMIGFGALLSIALLTRSLNETATGGSRIVLYEDYAGGFAASRWISVFLLGAALVEIIRGWLRTRLTPTRDAALPLLASMLLFYLGTLVVQAGLSEHTGFSSKELYVPIILAAVYYQPVRNLRLIFGAAKLAMLALTVGSLLGIALRPDFVLHRPDAGVISGIDWRLFGLTSHANTLGAVALLALLLELHTPYRRSSLHWLNLATALAVFVLAQSRTAWVAAVVIAAVVAAPLAIMPNRQRANDPRGFSRAVWTLLGCIGLLIVVACGMVALGGTEYLQRKTDLGTLNGRFQIWDITLQAWRENVLFGYGPEVWGAERRLRFNMFHVGQAHNQFVQTLGEAGLVGLAFVSLYLLVLVYAASKCFARSRGFVLALLLLLLARCVTEAPLRSEGLLSWSTFLHVLLLTVACHHLRQPAAQVASTVLQRPAAAGGARPRLPRTPMFSISVNRTQA